MKNIKETKNTKETLLFNAFKLFATSTYDRVTFDELEKATKLTRGAISYHFKTKDNLFMEVIDEYIFTRSSILQIPVRGQKGKILNNFIRNLIKHYEKETQKMHDLEIDNFNLAYFNIENQCLFFYPNMNQKVIQWLDVEEQVWENVIKQSIENGEIKANINPKLLARIFMKLYLGDSYIGIFHKNGQDLQELEQDFLHIYAICKV